MKIELGLTGKNSEPGGGTCKENVETFERKDTGSLTEQETKHTGKDLGWRLHNLG